MQNPDLTETEIARNAEVALNTFQMCALPIAFATLTDEYSETC